MNARVFLQVLLVSALWLAPGRVEAAVGDGAATDRTLVLPFDGGDGGAATLGDFAGRLLSPQPQSGIVLGLLAGLGSWFIPGLGQAITGHLGRGLLFFAVEALLAVGGMFLFIMSVGSLALANAGMAMLVAFGLVHLIQVVDAVVLGLQHPGYGSVASGPGPRDPAEFRPVEALALRGY